MDTPRAHGPGMATKAFRSIAALVLLAATVPALPAAGSGTAAAIPLEDAPRQRTKRWWLDTWSHSMQERLFVQWMNAQNGGTAWQLTMAPVQVNSVYAWWLQAVWPTL